MEKILMKYIVIFLFLTSCFGSDYDFNPTTTIFKQIIKEKK